MKSNRPKKPREPKRPTKPLKPQKFVCNYKELSDELSYITLQAVVDMIPADVDFKDVTIESVHDFYRYDFDCDHRLLISYSQEVENSKYETQLKDYNHKLAEYKTKLKIWKEKIEDYKQQLKEYNNWLANQNADKIKKQIEKLQKELMEKLQIESAKRI